MLVTLHRQCAISNELGKSMNGENWPLVIDEPIEFETYMIQIQDFKNIYWLFFRKLENNLKIVKIPKDVNTQPVGFGNTRTRPIINNIYFITWEEP